MDGPTPETLGALGVDAAGCVATGAAVEGAVGAAVLAGVCTGAVAGAALPAGKPISTACGEKGSVREPACGDVEPGLMLGWPPSTSVKVVPVTSVSVPVRSVNVVPVTSVSVVPVTSVSVPVRSVNVVPVTSVSVVPVT